MKKPKGFGTKLTLLQAQQSFLSQAPSTLAWEPKFMTKTPRAERAIKNKHEEHDEQTQYVRYLRQCCPSVVIEAGLTGELWGMARHVPKGIFYGWIAKLKARGMLSGGSDLKLYFAPARSVFLECKHGKGKENTTQEGVRTKLTALGFSCYVINSMDDLIEVIKREGIPCLDTHAQDHE